MKLLYLSCHSVLEYDEVSLFHELGVRVFSPGAYIDPRAAEAISMRPDLPTLKYDPDDVSAFHELRRVNIDNKEQLTKRFVDRFDAVMVMHMPRWVVCNWEAMNHKPVIWRTIGQSTDETENQLRPYRERGLRIVRYSPCERRIPGYIGEDALIRFYKNPAEFAGWTGEQPLVITVNQSLARRGAACNFQLFQEVTQSLPRKLYGPGNEQAGHGVVGKVGFEELKAALRKNAVYFYVGTRPASYTLNFIEAWMTGIPMVAIGPAHGNAPYFAGRDLYEIPTLIENGISGFYSDDAAELRQLIERLLHDRSFGDRISRNGRESAIRQFGKEVIRPLWSEFFRSL